MSFKFIPMLCSTEIVRFLLDNRKTQTRRLNGLEKIDPKATEIVRDKYTVGSSIWIASYRLDNNHSSIVITDQIKCPFGEVGDVLWVRETYCNTWNGKKWETLYKAGEGYVYDEDGPTKWKPSIHMPKQVARLFYKITSIHVERLQDIKEQDAIAEGVKVIGFEPMVGYGGTNLYEDYLDNRNGNWSARDSFKSLWELIYDNGSWLKNPWVWVIKFEKIEQPENFI